MNGAVNTRAGEALAGVDLECDGDPVRISGAMIVISMIAVLCAVQWSEISAANPDSVRPRFTAIDLNQTKSRIHEMFHHGFNNYMKLAFPHDELKPLSGTWTDSLGELGGSRNSNKDYSGVAMTLIDALDTLVVVGNYSAFRSSVEWICENISFDQDIRVNVFEVNIRLLGGLLSAHMLAIDWKLNIMPNYSGGLLALAADLGSRLMPAFKTPTGIPYAWVNLRHGVIPGETFDSCTAGVGTLILEFGVLSHLTGDMSFYDSAFSALVVLWEMRDSGTGLVGNTLNVNSGRWTDGNSGIGAGVDSFYEYLFKAYVLFGNVRFLQMFEDSYDSVMKHLRVGPWYHEASMLSGHPTHVQFSSLQAFWPGLQVLSGKHLDEAILSQKAFFTLWERFGALPERFLLLSMSLHSSERYYPLRPELMESTYLLYQATGHPEYLNMGRHMVSCLFNVTYVEHGFASIRDVERHVLEDRMPSFFLAETCKYLFLLFDPDNFVHRRGNYVFSTEGHLFPVDYKLHQKFGHRTPKWHAGSRVEAAEDFSMFTCPIIRGTGHRSKATLASMAEIFGDVAVELSPVCLPSDAPVDEKQESVVRVSAQSENGAFIIDGKDSSQAIIRHLGTPAIEIIYRDEHETRVLLLQNEIGVVEYSVVIEHGKCRRTLHAVGASFVPPPTEFQFPPDASNVIFIGAPRDGCEHYPDVPYRGNIVVINRGVCTFVDKALIASKHGAAGVIIANIAEKDEMFFMGGDDRVVKTPVVMITGSEAEKLESCALKNSSVKAMLKVKMLHEPSTTASSKLVVFGSVDAFTIGNGFWKVLCKRNGDSYHLIVVS